MKSLEKIMCIDDEKDILEITRLSLETIGGFTVAPYSSGESAIENLCAERPDLILVDGVMPGMNGPETLQAIRGLPDETAKTPVVFMTACAQPSEIKECLDRGAIGVIVKPFDPMTLSDEIRKIWSRDEENGISSACS